MYDPTPAPRTFAVRGRILLGDRLAPGVVVIAGGRIARIARQTGDGRHAASLLDAPTLDVPIIAPGFVDLQVNGGFGVEVGDDPEAIRQLARRLPESGVTAFLPTIVTAPTEAYPRAYAAFAHAVAARRCAAWKVSAYPAESAAEARASTSPVA